MFPAARVPLSELTSLRLCATLSLSDTVRKAAT